MNKNLPGGRIRYLLLSVIKYAVLTVLFPVFLLLAVMYIYLHPNRSEGYAPISRETGSAASQIQREREQEPVASIHESCQGGATWER